jgi:hypothetical protein
MATSKQPTTATTDAAKKPVAGKTLVSPKAVGAKTVATKSAAAKTATVTKVAAKASEKLAATVKTTAQKAAILPAQRAHYVKVAAFYIAERRGFAPASQVSDWLEAEAEIDRLIASGHFGAGETAAS